DALQLRCGLVERFAPRNFLPPIWGTAHRCAQSVRILQGLAQRRRLGANMAARKNIGRIAANVSHSTPVERDFDAAHRFAQIAGGELGLQHQEILRRWRAQVHRVAEDDPSWDKRAMSEALKTYFRGEAQVAMLLAAFGICWLASAWWIWRTQSG